MRAAAITGHPETLFTNVTARQGGRWAEQTVAAAVARPGGGQTPRGPQETLNELTEMRRSGLLTEDELARLRGRLGV
jgi:hypothetical protein